MLVKKWFSLRSTKIASWKSPLFLGLLSKNRDLVDRKGERDFHLLVHGVLIYDAYIAVLMNI